MVSVQCFLSVSLLFIVECSRGELTMDPPMGLMEDGDLVVDNGDDIRLTCRGDSDILWAYPDYEGSAGVEVRTMNEHGQFVSTLVARNVNYLDTGFFYCFPATADKNSPFTNSVYAYVRDPEHPFATNDTFQVIPVMQYSTAVIPCRPTDPSLQVILTKDDEGVPEASYDPRVGFSLTIHSVRQSGQYVCSTNDDTQEPLYVEVMVNMRPHQSSIDKPEVEASPPAYGKSHNVTLKCWITVNLGISAFVNWTVPNPALLQSSRLLMKNYTSADDKGQTFVVEATIKNLRKEDEGEYICKVVDSSANSNQQIYNLQLSDKYGIDLNLRGHNSTEISVAPSVTKIDLIVDIRSFPLADLDKITWHFNNHHVPLRNDSEKGFQIFTKHTESKLTILSPGVEVSGMYSLMVNNRHHSKTLNITVRVKGLPLVRVEGEQSHYVIGRKYDIRCDVISHPTANVSWYFAPCDNFPKCDSNSSLLPRDVYQYSEMEDPSTCTLQSTLSLPSKQTGVLKCEACNEVGCGNTQHNFLASDIDVVRGDLLNPLDGPKEVVIGDNVTLTCAASKYTYNSTLSWRRIYNTGKSITIADKTWGEETQYSHVSKLNITQVKKEDSGIYACTVHYLYKRKSKPPTPTYHMTVKDPEMPKIKETNSKKSVMTGMEVRWNCSVTGIPKPTITWYKQGIEVSLLSGKKWRLSSDNMTLSKHVGLEDDGEYRCVAVNKFGETAATHKLIIEDKTSPVLLMLLYVLLPAMLILVVILFFCLRRSQRLKREIKDLKKAGLHDFEKGNVESLNPELEISEQADLLPYHREKWEFPRDKLKLGKQLGSGAFGVVLKAEAYELEEEGVATTVAVKMVKRNCDPETIRALVSEFKIMIHLGKHVNVVNCLGACTDSINKRELLVLVEYCQYGNLHSYLQKHRGAFINQVNPKTGDFDPVLIQPVSPMSKTFPMNGIDMSNGRMSTMTSSGLSQATDTTLVLSDMSQATTIAEETPLDEDGYELPRKHEWRNSKKGDYNSGGLRPICTQDLICWSFQIARGMEYLASRKVLHGDLAARNVLLADDNIVKICDFGLSRSMYKDNNYMKKGTGPLPVKWMAPESIRDKVFSSLSDVWSFGVTMWELFSLAITPYPGIETCETLLTKLSQGYRMEKPKYATNQVYKVMVDCWHKNPHSRPSFTELTERMGGMLEDSVRSHYVDLNDVYLKENSVYLTQRDYLSMLRPPTYSNWSPLPENDYYIPMSPTRKEADEALELMPMLNQTSPALADYDSVPNSPTTPQQPEVQSSNIPDSPDSSPITKPKGNNYINVMQLLNFSNPSYQNVGRPNKSPYVNMPPSDLR